MNDQSDARTPLGEDARFNALDERLDAARKQEEMRTKPVAGAESDENYRAGNRVLAELLGGIVGGVLLGWVIDHFAGTAPWGLLVMMFFGIFIAFRKIIRMSNRPSE